MTNFLIIGNKLTQDIDLIDIGKGSYVLARASISYPRNYPKAMFNFLPTTFLLMHHSLEVLIKALLVHENVKYSFGNNGHKLIYLMELGIKKSPNLNFFEVNILKKEYLNDFLLNLQSKYNEIRYSFPGYGIYTEKLLDMFDELVFLFIEKFYELYTKKHVIPKEFQKINVPDDLIEAIKYNQKQKFDFYIINS